MGSSVGSYASGWSFYGIDCMCVCVRDIMPHYFYFILYFIYLFRNVFVCLHALGTEQPLQNDKPYFYELCCNAHHEISTSAIISCCEPPLAAATDSFYTDNRPWRSWAVPAVRFDHFLSPFESQFHAVTPSIAGVPHKVKRKEPYRRGYATIPEGKLLFCCGYSVSWQGEGEGGPWN